MAMLRSLLLLFIVFSMGNAEGKNPCYPILKACSAKPLKFCGRRRIAGNILLINIYMIR